jgi:hypothetical protein
MALDRKKIIQLGNLADVTKRTASEIKKVASKEDEGKGLTDDEKKALINLLSVLSNTKLAQMYCTELQTLWGIEPDIKQMMLGSTALDTAVLA